MHMYKDTFSMFDAHDLNIWADSHLAHLIPFFKRWRLKVSHAVQSYTFVCYYPTL